MPIRTGSKTRRFVFFFFVAALYLFDNVIFGFNAFVILSVIMIVSIAKFIKPYNMKCILVHATIHSTMSFPVFELVSYFSVIKHISLIVI